MSEEKKVVRIPINNLRDIPDMMRRIAQGIEEGEHGKPKHAILILLEEDMTPNAFLWGEEAERRYLAGALFETAVETLK